MFREGFDPHGLRSVGELQGSAMSQVQRIDALRAIRGDGSGGRGRGFDVPAPHKFRSGHLPRAVTVPVPREDGSFSASDMDESSDAEDACLSRCSPDSSPGADPSHLLQSRTASGLAPACKVWYYPSDAYSEISSSRDTVLPVLQQNGRRPVIADGYVGEEDYSDSGASSEFFSRTGRGIGVGVAPKGSLAMEDHRPISIGGLNASENLRGVPKQHSVGATAVNVKNKQHGAGYYAQQSDGCRSVTEKGSSVHVPSAPPIHGCDAEISQVEEDNSISCGTSVNGSNAPPVRNNIDITEEENVIEKNASIRISSAAQAKTSSHLFPIRVPTFHASLQGPWYSVLAYDACVRLCLHAWARGCMEAPVFLENECMLLRNTFSLQHILLQPEEELLAKRSSELVGEGACSKPKKIIGNMKVQVRKVRMSVDAPIGCTFSSFGPPIKKLQSFCHRLSNAHSNVSAGWQSLQKVRVLPHLPPNSSLSRHSLAYMHASAQYIKDVSGLLKVGVTSLRTSSAYETVQESYSCQLRLKSSAEDDCVPMQPGSGETHVFFPDSLGDDLIVVVSDSKGKICGRVVAQVASIADDPTDKLRWWSMFREPEHELVGRVQLYINYANSADENGLKCGSVAETVAYDIVLEVAMKAQQIQQRNLVLHGCWKWLLSEFASYYGVSDAYTRLRYLSYVMDIATPTADCLTLIHDLLLPVVMKSRSKNILSHQENRILGEIEEQVEQLLAMVFENYKSLDESCPSGLVEVFTTASGFLSPALEPAIKLYNLLFDVLSPEDQLKLCGYFQVAAKKRSRSHLLETDKYIAGNSDGILMDAVNFSTAYEKMKNLCHNMRNEIFTDIEIHNYHVLPSFVDLPNLSASIYSLELSNRLRSFLVACPPTGPSPPVANLVIATADFQKDLASWNIHPIKGGVDARELFHLYIVLWIQDKRKILLESCKLDKVKWSGVRTKHMTTPFVDEMYDLLTSMLTEYEVIICRWPEYIFALENAIADVEKAVIDALEKQYADVLAPLKDFITPKKFGLKYVQKLTKRSSFTPYIVPDELGVLLNTLKRLLDVLRPRIEEHLKSWSSCIPNGMGTVIAGEKLGEVTLTLRTKFRNYMQAVVEKLVENTHAQNNTKLKRIIQDSKDLVIEGDIRSRMQPLKDQLIESINQVHTVFEARMFVAVCRGFWDRIGQDVASFLENRKENRLWYKGARVTITVLDDTFASQMQQLLGNALQEKDLEPPRSVMEVRSILCKDAPFNKDSHFYY